MPIPFHIVDVLPTGYAVSLNAPVIVTTSEPIDPGSITDLALTVSEADTYTIVEGEITSSGALTQLVFEPVGLFKQETRYRAIVPVPGIRAQGGGFLEETYVFRFSTGSTIDASGGESVGYYAAADIEPPAYLRTGVVTVTIPGKTLTDGSTLVPSGALSVGIEFNAPPSGDLAWLSGYFTFTSQDVLGYTLDGSDLASDHEIIQQDEGALVTIQAAGGAGLVLNTEYTLTVKAGINASGYLPMTSDYVLSWTTDLYPVYSTVVLVRLLAGPFISEIPDDTLRRVILKYSQRATRFHNGTVFEPVPYYVTDYVTCQTAADAIRQEFSGRAGSSGSKHLGDLTVEIRVQDIDGLMKETLARLQACADEAFGVLKAGGRTARPLIVIRNRYTQSQPGVAWSRLLPGGGNAGASYMSPSDFMDTSERYAFYEKVLSDNPLPSRLQYGNHVYALTNEGT